LFLLLGAASSEDLLACTLLSRFLSSLLRCLFLGAATLSFLLLGLASGFSGHLVANGLAHRLQERLVGDPRRVTVGTHPLDEPPTDQHVALKPSGVAAGCD
jgi:hypothetical protein